MSTKVATFIRAYIALTPTEKSKIAEVIKALENASPPTERMIIESLSLESFGNRNAINFAPTPGSCPTCGK